MLRQKNWKIQYSKLAHWLDLCKNIEVSYVQQVLKCLIKTNIHFYEVIFRNTAVIISEHYHNFHLLHYLSGNRVVTSYLLSQFLPLRWLGAVFVFCIGLILEKTICCANAIAFQLSFVYWIEFQPLWIFKLIFVESRLLELTTVSFSGCDIHTFTF